MAEELFQPYKELKELADKHQITAMIPKILPILEERNIWLNDKVVAMTVSDDITYYNKELSEKFLLIKLFTEHGLKVIVKVGDGGYVNAWIEGINEVFCGCGE